MTCCFYPPESLAEHVLVCHGFPPGKTINDQTHRADHDAHDRAVAWLSADDLRWGRVSAVLPIAHPYQPL
jgi:hypothetical protein